MHIFSNLLVSFEWNGVFFCIFYAFVHINILLSSSVIHFIGDWQTDHLQFYFDWLIDCVQQKQVCDHEPYLTKGEGEKER